MSSIASAEAGSSRARMTSSAIRPASSSSSRGRFGGEVLGVLAQPGGGADAERGEVVVGEPVEVLPPLLRQGDAHRQQGALATLARGQLRARAAAPEPPRCRRRGRRRRLAAARGSRRHQPSHHHRRLEVEPLRHPAHQVVAARRLPHPGEDRRHLGERPVALGRRGDVGAVQHQPDLKGGQVDRALDQRPEALGAALGSPSSRPGPRPPASPPPAAASSAPPRPAGRAASPPGRPSRRRAPGPPPRPSPRAPPPDRR